VTTLYWLRYLFLALLVVTAVWMAWFATADLRAKHRR
jgi:hypothetical protein